MVEDVVRIMGYATLGSRLKRIGERLQVQTQEIMTGSDGDAPAVAQNAVLVALDRTGPLSIGDLSRALGQSQPGVTRMVAQMKAAGLVETRPVPGDKRVNVVVLSARGDALTKRLKATAWPMVEAAVAEACRDLSGSLLEQLDGLESALAERPLRGRSDASQAMPTTGAGDLETEARRYFAGARGDDP